MFRVDNYIGRRPVGIFRDHSSRRKGGHCDYVGHLGPAGESDDADAERVMGFMLIHAFVQRLAVGPSMEVGGGISGHLAVVVAVVRAVVGESQLGALGESKLLLGVVRGILLGFVASRGQHPGGARAQSCVSRELSRMTLRVPSTVRFLTACIRWSLPEAQKG